MTTARTISYLWSIAWLVFLAGCGGAGDGFTGPRGKVSGSVTFDGSPVPPGSTVMFRSKEGNTYLAAGTVKADGKYEAAYEGGKDLPAVTYLVQITPPAGEPGVGDFPVVGDSKVASDPKNLKPLSPDELKKLVSGSKGKDISPPFPEKYNSFTTSKLTFDVKEGSNTADFKLEK